MTESDLEPINPFPFMLGMLIVYIPILILLGSCKTSKTHCDAYGELKQQHDVYHAKPEPKITK